ncbi:ABC transporter permease [Photobacterium frigidiphilum]|uniref:ABC transporter permease n=1 Tax=Photobacterium frigidiphilum TaxID=264736 RepID=A0A2T3J7D1_9GAMM|nr:TolC family protein [Photobacterium frigidiphilum]PSU44636.1 ABC transporter permease [Photobacterium frigidiphilum]
MSSASRIKVMKSLKLLKNTWQLRKSVSVSTVMSCALLLGFSQPLTASAANLLEVVDIALQENLSLNSAETGLRSSQYDLDINRGKFLPSLNVSANTNWNDGTTHQTSGPNTNNSYNDHGVNVTLSQTLFNLGDIYSHTNTRIDVDIETLKTEQTRQTIIRDASTTYFEYLKSSAQIRATQAELNSSISRLKLITRNVELGNMAGTEKYEVLAQKEGTANTLRTLKKDQKIILTQLEMIVQRPLNPDYDLQSTIEFTEIPSDRERRLNDILYTSGYDLLIAQQQVKKSRQTLKETGATFVPSLTGSIGYTYDDTNDASATVLPDNGVTEEAVYTLKLDVPILNGGRDYYRYEQNKFDIERTEIDLQDSKDQSQQQFDEFIYNINDYSASLASLKTIIQANYASYNGIQKAHKLGTRTITDLLSAESKLFSSIRDYESARYDYIINLVQLNELIGNLNMNTIGKIAEQMSPVSDRKTDSPIPLHLLVQ